MYFTFGISGALSPAMLQTISSTRQTGSTLNIGIGVKEGPEAFEAASP